MSAMEYRIPDAVFISHCHTDHSSHVHYFAQKGVPVLCSNGTAKGLSIHDWQRGTFKEFNCMKLDAVHDCIEPSMIVVDDKQRRERLFFCTDTESIPHKIDGITHLMIEINWSKYTTDDKCIHLDRSKNTHLSLEEALSWMKKQNFAKLQQVHLLHLSDANSNEEYFKQKIAALTGVPVYVH